VTDTVRALTRTYLPYRYTSLGTQQLKGIAGGIPLFRVEAVPSSARARVARQLGARRGRVLVLAGLVVVALLAATGVYALNRPAECLVLPASTKDVVARIDPARQCVVAVHPVGQRPASAVFVDGVLWVANLDDQTLTWIDPTAATAGTTAAGGPPIALAPAAKSVVVLDHTARIGSTSDSALVQNDQVALVLNARKRMLDSPARLPDPRLGPQGSFNYDIGGYQAIIVVADSAWVTNANSGQVVRIPVGGGGATAVEIEAPTSVGIGSPRSGIGPIASGRGTVWVANLDQPVVYRMDGFQAPAARFSLDGSNGSRAIDVTDDAIWLIRTDGRLTRMRLGGSIATFDTGGSSTNLTVGADTVWVVDTTGRMVRSIDPATGAVLATIPVGGHPNSIAIGPDGSAWVTIQAP
jgi:streptogramin lyase